MTRSRVAAAGLLLAVFILGAVAGGFAMASMEHRGGFFGRHVRGRSGFVERLTRELDLTPAQQDSVRAILSRLEPNMDSLWREVRPRFDSMRGVARDEIRAQLTPEQAKKHQEMTERWDREARERRSNASR